MKQYQPLYLKYRPQKFSELIGQEVVTRTLTNAILYNKIVHAYLFCGPKGTGKTSTARILAKSLNCQSGITAEPCGKCVNCQSITNGNSLDVIEIDAASHRKVEDAEDLVNRVNLGTYGSRFKIYIIDEVHMLTDHAFNALLKTLEEPPKNVIFILATTEDYKVIPTIVSRCQRFDFKPVSQSELEGKIKDIAKSEGVKIDQASVDFIVKRANGCLRDAISLLDQISVLRKEDGPIKSGEIFTLFGTVDRSTLFDLIGAVLALNRQRAVNLAEEMVKSGKDVSELLKSLLELVIDLAKAKIDSEYREVLSVELGNDLKILDTVKQSHVLKVIDRLQDSQSKLRFALSQELQFMVEIMSMLDEDFLLSVTELKERVERLETGEGEPVKGRIGEPEKERIGEGANRRIAEPATSEPQSLDTMWGKIISQIESNPTKVLLVQSGCYLLDLTSNLLEIGLSKDMFLPRLEQDIKKKETILRAVKLSCGIEPAAIRFRYLPKEQIEPVQTAGSEELQNTTQKIVNAESDDDFSKAVKDLLGAKQIN